MTASYSSVTKLLLSVTGADVTFHMWPWPVWHDPLGTRKGSTLRTDLWNCTAKTNVYETTIGRLAGYGTRENKHLSGCGTRGNKHLVGYGTRRSKHLVGYGTSENKHYFLALFYTRQRPCVESACVFNCSFFFNCSNCSVVVWVSTFL